MGGLPPDVDMTDYTEARLPSEQKWYALTGRVVDAKVEDGDIHLALQDADGRTAELSVPKFLGRARANRVDLNDRLTLASCLKVRHVRDGPHLPARVGV